MKKTFEERVTILSEYIKKNKLESLVLGISGGIDSTLCAAICCEACERSKIKFIGRNLTMSTNKHSEISLANSVGNCFCTDFKKVNLSSTHKYMCDFITGIEQNKIENLQSGNIQARLRMIYLYNLASLNKGMVIDTDNLTEHYLGFWTIHGDEGDYKLIADLWKTEVYDMAKEVLHKYSTEKGFNPRCEAIRNSILAVPTDGLGIADNDLEQIGAESYEHVDQIIKSLLDYRTSFAEIMHDLHINKGISTAEIANVYTRYYQSRFKRLNRPINPYIN